MGKDRYGRINNLTMPSWIPKDAEKSIWLHCAALYECQMWRSICMHDTYLLMVTKLGRIRGGYMTMACPISPINQYASTATNVATPPSWVPQRGSIGACVRHVLLSNVFTHKGMALTHLPKCPLRRDNPWVPHLCKQTPLPLNIAQPKRHLNTFIRRVSSIHAHMC